MWVTAMKSRGRHPSKALSAAFVRSVEKSGRYADGNGLYLVVDPSGAKRWLLRVVIRGKRCDVGLGGLGLVSLAEAREQAAGLRKLAREGVDPLSERRKAKAVIPTFAEAAERVHSEHKASWKNPKHIQQWINTLRQYTFPILGSKRVDQIGTPDILEVLAPIWLTKPETASRVRQRIGAVLDWAKAAGFRVGDNPINGIAKGLPKQSNRTNHHAAAHFSRVPSFIETLRNSSSGEMAKLAFEFLILTASRTSEVLGAEWAEIDLEEQVWTVPPERIKTGRQHRVPLSPRCIEILRLAAEHSAGTQYVFPGRSKDKPFSNMVFLKALERMNLDVTAHGFRSSFRDWASEQTNFSREVCEMALAHAIESRVEAAYRRGDLFEKRRELMAAWSEYVAGGSPSIEA
jgi:integrase